MNAPWALGLLQEALAVIWTIVAVWTVLPGGDNVTAASLTGLVAGGLAIALVAILRRPHGPRSGGEQRQRDRHRLASH